MKIAEQQSRDAGLYDFDRNVNRASDLIHLPRFPIERLGHWQDVVYSDTPWTPIDLISLYEASLAEYPKEDQTGYTELADALASLKTAGYRKGYNTFYLAKVPKEHELWNLGHEFGFHDWTMSFSIQCPNSLTAYHLDHRFELVNKEKVLRGGFTKDYYNRKILIAVDDWRPGQAFNFGSQVWQNWQAGDAVILKNAMPHWGHNFTEHDRIFFIISGFADKEWCDRHEC